MPDPTSDGGPPSQGNEAKSPRLSVVIPTYNEGHNIGPLIEALNEQLEGVETEIIVVDDDSTDQTAANAGQAGARVIVRTDERGLGTAVVRGLDKAKGEYVAVMDADFQHPPEAVQRMLERAEQTDVDVVIGSRYAPDGGEAGFTAVRRVVSFGAGLIARTLLTPVRSHNLTDPMSGLFLVKRDRINVETLHPKGYKILLEILARSDPRRVEEIGFVFDKRRADESKLGISVSLLFLLHVLLLAWADPKNQRVMRFALIGGSGIFVNLGILFLLHGIFDVHDLIAVPIAIEASIISNFLLNDHFTFRDRRNGSKLRRLGQFNTVSLVALIVNFTAYALLTRVFGVFYLVAQLIAILVAFSTNYMGNLHWTYGQENRFQLRRTLRRIVPWLPFVLVVALASGTYFTDLDEPHGIYYDEGHYVTAAKQFQNDIWHDPCWQSQPYRPVNNPHPPLAKLIMAASMEQFDTDDFVFEGCRAPDDTEEGGKERYDEFKERLVAEGNPYAWRGPSAPMATFTVFGIGLAAAWIFRNPYIGALAGGFVALDNMVLVMGRTAMLDIYAAGFAALALAFAARPTRTALFLSILFLGLGFASKFVVAFIGPVVLAVAWWVRHRDGVLTLRTGIATAIAYPVSAIGILLASYLPWWRIWVPKWGVKGALVHWYDMTKAQFEWGTNATFSRQHPDQTAPMEWLSMKHPALMYTPRDGFDAYLLSVGNPVIWWGGLAICIIAIAYLVYRGAPLLFRRDPQRPRPTQGISLHAQALVLVSFLPLVALFPFFLIDRPQFLFYMVFVTPFFALPLAGAAKLAYDRAGYRGLIAIVLFLVAAGAIYWHYFPITYGLETERDTVLKILDLLPWTEHAMQ